MPHPTLSPNERVLKGISKGAAKVLSFGEDLGEAHTQALEIYHET
jgi:hypothetical protein